jgi:hypothetical protein
MEHEGSLPCSQETAIGLDPVTHESSQHSHNLDPKKPAWTLSAHLRLRLCSVLCPSVFPTKIQSFPTVRRITLSLVGL